MFTHTATPRAVPEGFPGILEANPISGFPMVVQATAFHPVEDMCVAAVETTLYAPGAPGMCYPEWTFLAIPACGHMKCARKVGSSLN